MIYSLCMSNFCATARQRTGPALIILILTLTVLPCLPALEKLEARLPEAFAQAGPELKACKLPCTYAGNNAAIIEDGQISFQPSATGQGWELRMKAGKLEMSGSTGNGLVYQQSRFTMAYPDMVQQWNYDTRTSQTLSQGQGYVTKGTLERGGKVNKSFSADMGKTPLDSDFLGFQLAALLARGAKDFNADFFVKNRAIKVNADFTLVKPDAAKIAAVLGESGPFKSGLALILKPGCWLYTIKLTGMAGVFFSANVYAAFTDEAQPAFLAYWNTNASEREGLWIRPGPAN